MTRIRARGEAVRRYLLENVQANPFSISKLAMDHFGVSRQAINRHLGLLVQEGALIESGNTRSRSYRPAPIVNWQGSYPLNSELAEDVVWRDDVGPVLGNLPENALDLWQIGFTEIFNNAGDHSGGLNVRVSIQKTAVSTEMSIMDDGIGIFRKIQKDLDLLDERHAIFELSKGKLTTDPTRHSGEGIFFTSRMFDAFDILSGGLFFSHVIGSEEDWLLERTNPASGTYVSMRLANHTARTAKKVYDFFTSGDPDDQAFTKTVVPVRLAQYGNDKLVSRSQAKRVMARVELFKTVVLDFEDVPSIGQAFADEAFRVFTLAHPDISVVAIRTNSDVRRMILRAQSGTGSPQIEAVAPTDEDSEWLSDAEDSSS
jgi:anti-sigma regulatory factor (Ser/Thr protein kinase)/biotin operon repressor